MPEKRDPPRNTPNRTQASVSDSTADSAESERRDEPPWQILGILLLVTTAALTFYGWSVGSKPLLLIEILLGTAALTVGGFFGFLFGMPRAVAEVVNGTGGAPVKGDTTSDTINSSSPAREIRYQPSTNLEQVSDWLTKILIGVGLVQLGSIGKGLAELGELVANSQKPPIVGASIVSQVVAIVFLVLGFLASFLWTRIYYGAIQSLADRDLLRRLRRVEETAKGAKTVAKLLASGKLAPSSPAGHQTVADEHAAPESDVRGIAPFASEQLTQFLRAAVEWDSDPVREVFRDAPQEANGRRLEGEIAANLGDAIVIRLRVRQTGREPLVSEVLFLLHPTFPERVLHATPRNGVAEVSVYAEGWFTAGAVADDGQTILALDLRRIPGVPDWFMER